MSKEGLKGTKSSQGTHYAYYASQGVCTLIMCIFMTKIYVDVYIPGEGMSDIEVLKEISTSACH